MNKAYLFVPLIATLVFGGYYWNFRVGYNKEMEAKKVAVREAHIAKLRKEEQDRRDAIEKANQQAEARKQQKPDKEAREKKAQEERAQSYEAQRLAQAEERKLLDQVKGLNREIEAVKKEIAAIEADKKVAISEEAFQQTYVVKAQENVRGLVQTLEKIEAADKILKERAAAAAKKS